MSQRLTGSERRFHALERTSKAGGERRVLGEYHLMQPGSGRVPFVARRDAPYSASTFGTELLHVLVFAFRFRHGFGL